MNLYFIKKQNLKGGAKTHEKLNILKTKKDKGKRSFAKYKLFIPK